MSRAYDGPADVAPERAPFLTAEWRHLLMINFAVDPARLAPNVPAGTELDYHEGTSYVSLVAFLFLRTTVRGCPVPGHRNFEEVNLRFYVRRQAPEGWRRGVVFLKELVPRRAIAAVARRVYHEPYEAVPMAHALELEQGELKAGARLRYSWQYGGRWQALGATTSSDFAPLQPESHEAFIAEHYWGYTRRRDGTTHEYQVAHPPWRVAKVASVEVDCDIAAVYGPEYSAMLSGSPTSVFVADGSPVSVFRGAPVMIPAAGA